MAVTAALVDTDALQRSGDGTGVQRAAGDRLAAPLHTPPYRLGPRGEDVFGPLGVDLPGGWPGGANHCASVSTGASNSTTSPADWVPRC